MQRTKENIKKKGPEAKCVCVGVCTKIYIDMRISI